VSSRADRNARFTNKPPSSKSTPSDSIFSEPPDDFEDVRATRRRNRGHEDTRDKPLHLDTIEMVHPDDEIQEDDEAVRCICGFDDYPGPPPLDGDAKHGRDDSEVDVYAVLELTDEVSGFFVQCDICKVWQHGACVGIMTEESSPDEYFCEQCRKDFHKIHVASNGCVIQSYVVGSEGLCRSCHSTAGAVFPAGARGLRCTGASSVLSQHILLLSEMLTTVFSTLDNDTRHTSLFIDSPETRPAPHR